MSNTISKLKYAFVAVALVAFGSFSQAGSTAKQDIVAIAANNPQFSTLVMALQAADLVTTLQGDGPFTVFAPTDEAFANLPEGTLASLLKPANKAQLIAVLTYHVVPGSFTASQVAGIDSAPTVQGQTVRITATDTGVRVDEANVVAVDIEASNGVIHVIDRVILPR
jgi:uncharacterized surface protein with fasciclin (FAS1) repeats